MTTRAQSRLFMGSVSMALVALALWSYARLNASRLAAQSAAENVQACRRLAQQIVILRDRPSLAATEARATTELARRVEEAAQKAQLPPDRIVRIDPQASRRIGESTYK